MEQIITPEMVIAEAREWLGTRYLHRQRTKGRFCDCVGLVIGVARRFDLGDYTQTDYEKSPDPRRMGRDLKANLNIVERPGLPHLADILWLIVRHDPSHLAIVADYEYGGLSIIHAHSTAGRVVEHRLDDRWMARIHRVFRYRGLAD